ncbi:hypothetical protein AB3X96_36595 [Paraburkholderia sp. BR13439]|uniref:hypothetical protein n=1 Tax=Paraburkholderia sp. BR13439 TaxID=3236996 RepID=UPI0034CDD152
MQNNAYVVNPLFQPVVRVLIVLGANGKRAGLKLQAACRYWLDREVDGGRSQRSFAIPYHRTRAQDGAQRLLRRGGDRHIGESKSARRSEQIPAPPAWPDGFAAERATIERPP